MARGRFFKNALALVAICFSFAGPAVLVDFGLAASEHPADNKIQIKVGRKPLAEALLLFARQAGISIARPSFSHKDGKSRAVFGKYTLENGLLRLLAGSGFGFQKLSANSVRIIRLSTGDKPTPQVVAKEVDTLPAIPEIMVSATRRKSFIQRLPYSISAVPSSQLADLGSKTTQHVTRLVAGIYATGEGTGRNKVIIRGLSDGPFSGRVQSLVSTYQDYTRVAYNAPDPGLMLYDIDRIEILRGPQGTLYGSGALGGLYRIVNREPALADDAFSLSSRVDFTRHGDPASELSATLNLGVRPNKLAIRTLAYYRVDGGYIDDIRLEQENVNRTSTKGARFSAKLKPSDTWHAILSVGYQRLDADDGNYFNGSLRHLERDNYLSEPRRDEFFNINATFQANFSWGEIVSATSWIHRSIDSVTDASTAVPILAGLNVRPSPYVIDRDIRTITNETHITSDRASNFNWLLGFFGSHRMETVASSLSVPGAAQETSLGDRDQIYSERLEEQLNEIAVFGELTYPLTKQVSVTLGARLYYYDDDAVSDLNDIGALVPLRVTGQQKKTGFTPKILLAYQYSTSGLAYLQASEGYRVGGINLAGLTPVEEIEVTGNPVFPPITAENPILGNFNSDRLRNYELGLKNSFLQGTLILNSAVFYASWNKIQSYKYGFNGLPEIANIGNARIFGIEAEASFRTSSQLGLEANVSWNDSRITDTNGNFGAEVGSALPGAPSFSAGITVTQSFQMFGFNTTSSLDHTYVGGAQLLFNRHDSPRMDAYHLTNFRLSFLADPWQVTVFVNNVLDTKANIFPFGNPFALNAFQFGVPSGEPTEIFTDNDTFADTVKQHTAPRPRSVGLAATLRF